MQIRVLYFQMIRQLTGCAEERVELPGDAKVSDAIAALVESHPELEKVRGSLLYAVNEEWAAKSQPLSEGDVLALMPPVSGG